MIYNLPKDMASEDVLRYVQCSGLPFLFIISYTFLDFFMGLIANPYLI